MDFVEEGGTTTKRPMVKWKEYQDRRATKEEVYEWIEKGWSLGVITGHLSGIDVVDDDRIKANLDPWVIDSAVVARTKSGGKHYYFLHRSGVRNTSNAELRVDIRGEGGYVVVPPFFGYKWEKKPAESAIKSLGNIPNASYLEINQRRLKTAPSSYSELVGVSTGGRDNSLLTVARRLCNSTPENEWPSLLDVLYDINQTYDPPLSDSVVREKLNQAINFVRDNPLEEKKTREAEELTKEYLPKMYSAMTKEEINKQKLRKSLPLGIPEIDSWFPFPTGYYVICANPGAGKGWFAFWLIRKFWELHGIKSVFFSLEMSISTVTERLKQAWSDLTQFQFQNGDSVAKGIELMQKDILIPDDFEAEDQSKQTPELFKAKFDFYYNLGYRVFHFDHLHELDGANDNNFNQKVTSEWAKVFQQISKEHEDAWLFVFAQPNGAAAAKKIIQRTDIAGSKAITQKCDYFVSLNREVEKDEKGDILINNEKRDVILWVDKSRHTSQAHRGVRLFFAETGNYFKEASDQFKLPTPLPAPLPMSSAEAKENDDFEKDVLDGLIGGGDPIPF